MADWTSTLARTGVLLILALPVSPVSPAAAAASGPPGETQRITLGSAGEQTADRGTDVFQHRIAITPDGRYVAFASAADNLVRNDGNVVRDVFVYDTQAGTTERVSVASNGEEGDHNSTAPSITADGRYVAFMSEASNLVGDDLNGVWDVFVHDRETNVTERVSVTSRGREADAWSRVPSISADGRYVAFDSGARMLVDDDGNGRYDVFVHDRHTRETRLLTRTPTGAVANGASYSPAISADGRTVAFYSAARDLVADDTNGYNDVFVVDVGTGNVERVSVSSDGAEGNDWSYSPSISADGQVVAFLSRSSNLVPNDQNGAFDYFVRDRGRARTERVSVSSGGAEHDDTLTFVPGRAAPPPLTAAVSPDGRHVAFVSRASNLVSADTNGVQDVFVRDRMTGETERVSVSSTGEQADLVSLQPALSSDGRNVAFTSYAAGLVPDDTNDTRDVFLRRRGPTTGVGALTAAAEQAEATRVRGWARYAPEVRAVRDPAGDAAHGSGPAGTDLVAAAAVYRPELEDLLFRAELTAMPGVRTPGGVGQALDAAGGVIPTVGGVPGVGYEFRFTYRGSGYELRVSRSSAPRALLFRCGPTCTHVATVPAAFAVTGLEVVVALPLELLGQWQGQELRGVKAVTTAGDVALTGAVPFDDAPIGTLALAPPSLHVTGYPSGVLVAELRGSVGRFDVRIGASSLPATDSEIEARACVAERCGARRVAHAG